MYRSSQFENVPETLVIILDKFLDDVTFKQIQSLILTISRNNDSFSEIYVYFKGEF